MITALLLLLTQASLPASAGTKAHNAHGRTLLHFAASTDGPGKLELIRLLLYAGADPNARDEFGASPLDEAVWKGSVDRAQLLLDAGAKLNAQEPKTGATPLNEAAYKGHTLCVEFLLSRGADLSIRDYAGFSPLGNAIREHHPDILSVLLKHNSDPTVLIHLLEDAVHRGQEDTVLILLDAGVDVNARFASGSTALYDASLKGDDNIVSLLVSRGANVDGRDAVSLTTPLYAAAAFGRSEVAATLLLWGADPNLVGKEGFTPLHAAQSNRYSRIAEQIRSAGGH